MFKIGDKVIYAHRHKAAVIDCDWVNNEFTIEFDDPGLIPPKMKVLGGHLQQQKNVGQPIDLLEEFERLVAEGNIKTTCRKCQQLYATKPIFTSLWTGCEGCGRSKEDIMKGL